MTAKLLIVTILASLALGVSSTSAAFVRVDNFQSPLTTGALAGQGNWSAIGSSTVSVVDTGGGQNVAQFTSPNLTGVYNNAGTPDIANGTTGTLFFQLTMPTLAGNDISFGLSDVAAPTSNFADFEAYVGIGTSGIRLRDGASFTAYTALTAATTYNVWLVANNTADTATLYLQGGVFTDPTLIVSGSFRNGTSSALASLSGVAGGSNTAGSIQIDNIFINVSSENLLSPIAIPEPSTFALFAGVAVLAMAVRRRA